MQPIIDVLHSIGESFWFVPRLDPKAVTAFINGDRFRVEFPTLNKTSYLHQ